MVGVLLFDAYDQRSINFLSADMTCVISKLEKISKAITSVKNDALRSGEYEDPLISAIYQLENLTLHLRKVANNCFAKQTLHRYEQMMDNITHSEYHISMSMQDSDITRITLPCLLPCYKDNKKNIITEPLNFFLRQYKKDKELIQYESIVMVVINHVSRTKKGYGIRDNDNYEYKQLVNTLAFWFLPDDDYRSCKMFNGTAMDEADYTEVFLVPKEEFAEWYAKIGEKIIE
jgi:hypothetical protein